MSQAVQDLPDPLSPPPALPLSDPDDLLSKMADDAIDQLMAQADRGQGPAAAPGVTVDEHMAVAGAAPDVAAAPSPEPVVAVSGEFMPAMPPASRAVDPQSSTSEADALSPTGTHEAAFLAATAAGASSPSSVPPAAALPPAADVKALLAEHSARPSWLLWPLAVLNAPFGGMSDRARTTLGLIGLITLVPAVCAIVYVLFLKR